MADITLPDPLVNDTVANALEVMADLNAILAEVNGNLEATNLADNAVTTPKIAPLAVTTPKLADGAATYPKLGVDVAAILTALGANVPGGAQARGKSVIATEETRSNTAYGLLTTADKVPSLVVPANAIVRLSYSALWQESVAGAGRAAIICTKAGVDNQLKIRDMGNAAPVTQAACTSGISTAGTYRGLSTFENGLVSGSWPAVANTSDVATGQAMGLVVATTPAASVRCLTHEVNGTRYEMNIGDSGSYEHATLGGSCLIRNLAAGTYDFSIQYKATSGSVSAKERELLIEVVSY